MQRGSAYTFRDVSIRMDFARSAFGVRYVLASLLETAGHRAYQKADPRMLHKYWLNNPQSKIWRKNEHYRRSRNKAGGLLPQRRMDEGSRRSLWKRHRQRRSARDGKYAGGNARHRPGARENRLVGEEHGSAQRKSRWTVCRRRYVRRAIRCGCD